MYDNMFKFNLKIFKYFCMNDSKNNNNYYIFKFNCFNFLLTLLLLFVNFAIRNFIIPLDFLI